VERFLNEDKNLLETQKKKKKLGKKMKKAQCAK
jgi:pyoverdine/dityrosine biosynthesis protein Dit1